uniref:Uncharacterized protein n=1 Tax=Rhizophora mucronata TaxID=61149 RepID=A0A2P2QU38_RHIMU
MDFRNPTKKCLSYFHLRSRFAFLNAYPLLSELNS